MSITKILSSDSETYLNHAQSMRKQIATLERINEQDAATCLPAVKIVHERLCARKKVVESRLLQLNGSYYQDPNSLLHELSQNQNPLAEQKLQEALAERDALVKELKEIEQKLNSNEKIQSFLKVRKVETHMRNLCGAYYGDPNGLLDRAWKAYQQGTCSKDEYDELERRKQYLIEKKEKLQVLCFDTTFSHLQQELPQIIIILQAEQREALEAVTFIQEVKNWCAKEEPLLGPDQKRKALIVCSKILECYITQSDRLELAAWGLTSLPKGIWKLVNLKYLSLSHNNLNILPPEIGNLKKLINLNIGHNKLQAVPSEIGSLKKLTTLTMGHNLFQFLPLEIFELENLTSLNIPSTKLQALPPQIDNFKELTRLDICANKLQILPQEIGNLKKMTWLDIGGNNLQTFPLQICNLENLTCLYTNYNQLQTLPSEIGNLKKLGVLYIERNELRALPSCLARLSAACSIMAETNRFSYEAIQTFQAQIAQQHNASLLRGPVFQFSIYDDNKLSDDSTLEEIITFWLLQFQGNFSCENVNYKELPPCMFENINGNDFYAPLKTLNAQDLNNLRTYLIRLKQTDDFKHPDACQGLMVNVMHMLHGACTNEDFNKMLFILLEDALSTCGDRVADASNTIHLQWLLLCGSKSLSKKDAAKLLIGAMRLDRLEDFARKFVKKNQLGDAIETILYFKVQLKEILGLPIATEGMLYPAMSGVTPFDLQEACAFVLEGTSSSDQIVQILSASEVWKKKLEQENAKELAEINEKFTAKISDVMENDTLPWTEIDVLTKQLTKERDEAIQAFMANLTLALKADVNAFCPASQVLAGLGITTKEQYSTKLGCTPKHLQSIGILTAADLEVLGIGCQPVSHMPQPKADVEQADDSRKLQEAALEKKMSLLTCLQQLEEKVKIGLKANQLDESIAKTYNSLLEKINVTCVNLQNQCQTPKTLLQTFGAESHLQMVNQVNALIDEFNAADCALQTAQLNAYISQWGVLKAWKGLKEQGICCLADLKEQRAMSQGDFFTMGV